MTNYEMLLKIDDKVKEECGVFGAYERTLQRTKRFV